MRRVNSEERTEWRRFDRYSIRKAREEREVLRAQLEQENAKLRELSGLPTNASNAAEMEREIKSWKVTLQNLTMTSL